MTPVANQLIDREEDLSDTAELEHLQLGATDKFERLPEADPAEADTDDEPRGFDPYNNA